MGKGATAPKSTSKPKNDQRIKKPATEEGVIEGDRYTLKCKKGRGRKGTPVTSHA